MHEGIKESDEFRLLLLLLAYTGLILALYPTRFGSQLSYI